MPSMLLRVDRGETADLARRVRNFLNHHPELQSLQVEVKHDVVTVRGAVGSARAQQLASEYCQRVAGVRRVINETTLCKN